MVAQTEVDLGAIRRQIEFYFSDSNLPRDKFLRAKTEENEHGYVDISIILSFKRIMMLNATQPHVINALKDSKLLAVDEEGSRVRRTTPLPAVSLFSTRAIFVKGWVPGSEPPTIEAISKMFNPSGRVLAVRIRRWSDESGVKRFKGSLLVEMETPEAAERVVAEEYEIEIPGQGKKTLEMMPYEEWDEKKREEKRQRKEYLNRKYGNDRGTKRKRENVIVKSENVEGGNDTGRASKRSRDEKQNGCDKNENIIAKSENKLENDASGNEVLKKAERKVVPGLILKFDGFGADVSREDIREAFEPYGEVAWVDFSKGDTNGFVRFSKEGDAEAVAKAMKEKEVEFGGKIPKFVLLEGEEEQDYWKLAWQKKDQAAERAQQRRRDGGGRNGRFRGGRRGGRGRGRKRF